ncbi:MAG: hypothetical protein QM765_33875 [Myxococcales bacterium]
MRLVAYLLPVALLACGPNGPGGESPIKVVDRQSAEEALSQAVSQNWVRCGAYDPAYGQKVEREYRTFYAAQVAYDDAFTQAGLDTGELQFDLDAAIRCVEEVRALKECVDSRSTWILASCRERYVPTRGEGEPCYQQCKAGLHCDSSANTCPGTCRPGGTPGLAAEGEPCAISDCGPGLYCRLDTCSKLPALGEDCTDLGVCATGTVCKAGRCSVKPGKGEVCNRGECKVGLYCVTCASGQSCTGGTGTCQVRKQGDSCETGGCDWGLACSPSNVCVPFGDLGGFCEPKSPWTSTCRVPFHCEGNTCVERKGLGATCLEEFDCADPLQCSEGVCTAPWCLYP